MKYVYDIILNFNDKFYEFYEWNESDNVDYIKKIPVFKVSNNVIRDLKLNKIQVDLDFIKSICDKCEIYMNNGIGSIEYACIFCSGEDALGIEFNYKGISMYKSSLMIDEEQDVIDYSRKLKKVDLRYDILSNDNIRYITRKEEYMINFINMELEEIRRDNDIDKLKYLYYECFNKEEDNISKIYLDFEKYITNFSLKLYNLLKLSYSNKI